jgi:hypothetical protein
MMTDDQGEWGIILETPGSCQLMLKHGAKLYVLYVCTRCVFSSVDISLLGHYQQHEQQCL